MQPTGSDEPAAVGEQSAEWFSLAPAPEHVGPVSWVPCSRGAAGLGRHRLGVWRDGQGETTRPPGLLVISVYSLATRALQRGVVRRQLDARRLEFAER